MTVVDEFRNIKRWVEYWLENDPACRDDDKLLIYRIMCCTTDVKVSWEDFRKIPSFESIRRVRQKLQEQGLFPSTDLKVVLMRQLREEEVRAWATGRNL